MINRVALANVYVGFDALRIHPLRTMLSVLGIIIGAASLVATMAISDGVMAFARKQIDRETSVQEVTISSRTQDFKRGQWLVVRDYPVFSMTDLAAARAQIRGADVVTLTLSGRSTVSYQGKRFAVGANLSTEALDDFNGLNFAGGRFFSAGEASHNSAVVVLNYALAQELATGRDPLRMLGEDVQVQNRVRRVVGVLAPNPFEEDRFPDLAIFAPIRGAESVLDPTQERFTPSIRLRAPSVEAVTPLREATIDWLAGRYTRWEDRVQVSVGLRQLREVEQAIFLSKLFFSAIVGISLLVGGIGIMNVLLASVAERTREIGIRKAVGARSGDIQTQFLAESVAIAAMGTGIGLAAGLLLAFVIMAGFRYFTNAPVYPVLSLTTVGIAMISSAVVGLVFGTYPARRAAKLAPIMAIAHE